MFVLLAFPRTEIFAQAFQTEEQFLSRLESNGPLPEKLLATRSVVVYTPGLTSKEIESVQQSFADIGVDAIGWFDMDLLLAGPDAARALALYLTRRNVEHLAFFRKTAGEYQLAITTFNGRPTFIESGQPSWTVHNADLKE